MPREFTRPPEGFVFEFGGLKTNSRPDNLPPTKYPVAVNVRSYSQSQIRTRPGLVALFDAGPAASAPDLRAYTALGTDDLPRILLRASDDTVWLDNGVQVGTLAGGGGTFGATMIPFRPNASPQPWMYIANDADYQKFSSPDGANVVTAQKVGIVEPQAAPDAGIFSYVAAPFTPGAWTAAGTAGATSGGNRVNDSITVIVKDPNPRLKYASYQVPSSSSYQIGMNVIVTFSGGSSIETTILDVFTGNTTAIGIAGIYYFAGTTGHCVIVATYLGGGPGIGDLPIGSQLTLTSLRRGALIQIGSEVLYVWSATPGPDGSVAIETSTAGAYTTADTFTILPAIQTIVQGTVLHPVTTVSDADFLSAITTGVGTLTSTPGNNPFINATLPFRSDDYITIGIKVDTLANLNEIKFLIDVGSGTFTQNYYYYTIRPSDIAAALSNAITQVSAVQTIDQLEIIDAQAVKTASGALKSMSGTQTAPGASQWTQITFPISALTRVGSDQTKSLQGIVKIQLLVNASGTVNIAFDAPAVVGGFAPDVGDIGSPYYYRIRPRSSVTGVVGNPSPATRYGVNSRRQSVFVQLPSTFPDPQMDTWDVFRLGGSVTQWRFVGQAKLNTSILGWGVGFLDIYGDDAARAGDALDFDNFEPWPSVDLPNTGTLVSLVGTTAVISTTDTDVGSYLPGTLVQIGGQNAYTLQTRPQSLGGNQWLLQFIENAGILTPGNSTYIIQEPLIANQHLPYMWGPDVNGTVFACGDSFRPGNVYFAKGNNPDSAPDSYNIEITPPTEPLQGGEVLDGLAFVGSTERWWALYPQPENPKQRYNFVQQPLTRGLAAPFGHCNDGVSIYWWARDGIYSSTDGSLTDADLYNVFPHEGIAGSAVTYNGVSILPPDYAQAPKFRLTCANGYLYATYPYIGGSGTYAPVLVCNLRTKAWSIDDYTNSLAQGQVETVYQIEQTAESQGVRNPVVLMARLQPGLLACRVCVQTDLTNDDGQAISCKVATFEFDGGDKRAPKQWGDVFVDCLPASNPLGITVTPMSLGATVAAPTTIPTNGSRVRVPISVGGIVVSDFLGAFFQWTDDFTRQLAATHLYLWQPSLTVQPAYALSWTSFGTAFGGKGYQHLRQLTLAWVSTAPVTITAVPFDGQAPVPIVVPSSGGAYRKVTFPFSANKGLLFEFTASSPAPFQIFNDDSELYVGEWGRMDAYQVFRGFGGRVADDAPI